MKEIVTYLNFDGNCREAMEFYQKCLGAELSLTPFSEAQGEFSKEEANRIIHARLTKGATLLMASDTRPGMPFVQGTNFSVSIQAESAEEIETLFQALSENGKVVMPLQDMFWGARFGMLTDQFGVRWMINFEKAR
jgi:PhnB protein